MSTSSSTGYDIYKVLIKDKTIGKYIKDFKLLKKIKKIRNKIFGNIKEFKSWLSGEITKLGFAKLTTIVICNYVENVYTKNNQDDDNDDDEENELKYNKNKELKRLQHKIKPIKIKNIQKNKNKKIKNSSEDED